MYCTCILVGQEKVFTGTEYSGHTCTHLHTLGWDTHFTTGNIHHTHNLQRTTHYTLHLTKRRLCKSICTHVPPSGCRQGGIHLLGRVLSKQPFLWYPSCSTRWGYSSELDHLKKKPILLAIQLLQCSPG